jgi:Tfp pilus assembly protein PilO
MTEKNKIIFSLISFCFFVLLLIFFLIFPLFKEIKNYSKEIISKKEGGLLLEKKLEDIENFKKNYLHIKENLEKIENLFVNLETPVDFIRFLENNSQDLSIKISLAGIGKEEKGWSYLNFSINTRGSFTQFLKFLEKIESSPYLIEINSLNIKRSEKEIEANFLIKVFAK